MLLVSLMRNNCSNGLSGTPLIHVLCPNWLFHRWFCNPTLYFLRKWGPSETKALCYQTLVRQLTEYASVIWDTHMTENICKLKRWSNGELSEWYSQTTGQPAVFPSWSINSTGPHYRSAEPRPKRQWCTGLCSSWSTLHPLSWYQPSLQGGITSPSLCRMPGLHSIRSLFLRRDQDLELSAHHP